MLEQNPSDVDDPFDDNYDAKVAPSSGSALGPAFLFFALTMIGLAAFFGRDKIRDYFYGIEMEASRKTVTMEPNVSDPDYAEMQKQSEEYSKRVEEDSKRRRMRRPRPDESKSEQVAP